MINRCPSSSLQIGDADLGGHKFNGFNLRKQLDEAGVDAAHFVCIKHSNDKKTYALPSTNGTVLLNAIVNNSVFAKSEIVHLHLIHNTAFDILHLPFLSTIKPLVITLHDPWTLGGHCIHHDWCDKWKWHCSDCRRLEEPFRMDKDSSSIDFAKKLYAIQASNISAIVASSWMLDKVRQSPVWRGKRVYKVPFGIDQNVFKPGNKHQAREILGIPNDAIVLFARTQVYFKGIKILKSSLKCISSKKQIVLITVGENNLLVGLPHKIIHKEYGWVNDDNKLALLYVASDIFLMPSEQEAFGMMAVEAMSCGRMVLALSGTALSEVIDAPHCGISKSQEEYATELQRIIDNPAEIEERGSRSFKYAQKEYGSDVYIQRILDVYCDVSSNFTAPENYDLLMSQIIKHSSDPVDHVQSSLREPKFLILVSRIYFFASNISSYFKKLCNYYSENGLSQTIIKIYTKIKTL